MPCLLVMTPFVYPPPVCGPSFRRHPFFQGLTVTASNKPAGSANLVSIFLSFFFPCSFFPCAYQNLASPKMRSLSWLSGRVHAEVGGNSPGLLQTIGGEKKLESDHQDVSNARLPCVRNEYTMRNKHFCCVLSWSGHDILKPRALPALLLQRQIVHAEFPGETPKMLP